MPGCVGLARLARLMRSGQLRRRPLLRASILNRWLNLLSEIRAGYLLIRIKLVVQQSCDQPPLMGGRKASSSPARSGVSALANW
jgi:hypothetical protein